MPLQDTEEYKDFSVLEKVYIGDTVQIFHEDLKLELKTKVTSYEFDALSQRYKKVILGNVNPKYGDTQRQYAKQQKEESTTALEQAIMALLKSDTQCKMKAWKKNLNARNAGAKNE